MKKQLTMLCLLTTVIFQSCKVDGINSNSETGTKKLEQPKTQTNRAEVSGTFDFGEVSYVVEPGRIERHKNGEFQYLFDIEGLNYTVREEKRAYFFENENESGEYIKVFHIEQKAANVLVFDATTSEGEILEGIEYSGEGVAPCGVPCIVGGLELLTSVLEYLKGGHDDPEDGEMGVPEACQAAVAAMAPYCQPPYGVRFKLEEDWFGGQDCHVECVLN